VETVLFRAHIAPGIDTVADSTPGWQGIKNGFAQFAKLSRTAYYLVAVLVVCVSTFEVIKVCCVE
jgi:hypothetical protein